MNTIDPKVLISVPTYGRPVCLPRIIACFDRLQYNNKHLVIINDDRRIKYKLSEDRKNIDIVNIDNHLNLSVKRNLFAAWDWDIMMSLDDDDIFLPERIQNHLKYYHDNPDCECIYNHYCYAIGDNEIYTSQWSAFTNNSILRQAWFKSGGCTSFDRSNHDDQTYYRNVKGNCNIHEIEDPYMLDFVYFIGNPSHANRYRNTFNGDVIKCDFVEAAVASVYDGISVDDTGYHVIVPGYEEYDEMVELTKRVALYPYRPTFNEVVVDGYRVKKKRVIREIV